MLCVHKNNFLKQKLLKSEPEYLVHRIRSGVALWCVSLSMSSSMNKTRGHTQHGTGTRRSCRALLSPLMMVAAGWSALTDLPLLPHQAFPEQGSDPLCTVLFVLPFAPLCFVNYFL